eukprot:13273243-Alexandrium_andersonii.AAC.1
MLGRDVGHGPAGPDGTLLGAVLQPGGRVVGPDDREEEELSVVEHGLQGHPEWLVADADDPDI